MNDSGSARPPALQQRRRRRTQIDIADAALRLFAVRALEETTAEEIAAAAGVSLRTFYRYCRGKEDVLTWVLNEGVGDLVAHLADAEPDGDLAESVLRALADTSSDLRTDERLRNYVVALSTMPALRLRWLEAAREAQVQLATAVARHLGPGPSSFEVEVVTGMVVSALTTTIERWATSGESLEGLARTAVQLLPQAVGTPPEE